VLAWSGAALAEAKVMRVSHQLPPKHHIAKLVESWAADIEARSGGAIDVQTFPANQAFKPKENFPAVARGKIEAALSVNFQWGKTIPEMNVTLKPYSFTDLELLKKWPGSTVAEYLQGKLEAKGVHNIAWLFTTRMSAYTSKGKALIKPADFQGVKIRGLNKLVDSGLEALVTDISAAYSRKYYEVQDHVTVSPLFSVYFHIYVNQDWWTGLSEAERAAVAEASAKAEADALTLTEESAGKAPGQLTEKGMKVHIHTADEIAAMKAIMDPPFTKAFLEASGDDGQKLLDMISAM
jgi:C4-dicarboxylate-binding protein DctP